MLKEISVFSNHGRQYISDLRRQPVSDLFRGLPVISDTITEAEIALITELCPSGALGRDGSIDMGKCMFCGECSYRIPGKIRFTNDYRIAVNRREDLIIKPGREGNLRLSESNIRKEVRKLFRRAFKLRQVSAGGDNSCEMELNASGNVNFDFGRYGVEFVASPRHADGVVITGPVTTNMAAALEISYNSMPEPRVIILVGTDAISGGLFRDSGAIDRTFIDTNNIDLYIPGNPAHPLTFINGVMDLLAIK